MNKMNILSLNKYLLNCQYIFWTILSIIFFVFIFNLQRADATYASGGYWLGCNAGSTCACGTNELVTGIYNNGNDPNGSINMVYCQNEISDGGVGLSYNWGKYNYHTFSGYGAYMCDVNSWMYAVNILWTGATQGFHCNGLNAGTDSIWGIMELYVHFKFYDADVCSSGYAGSGLGDVYVADGDVDLYYCNNISEPPPGFHLFYSSPPTISAGNYSYLYWSTKNALSVYIEGYGTNWCSNSPSYYGYPVYYSNPGVYQHSIRAYSGYNCTGNYVGPVYGIPDPPGNAATVNVGPGNFSMNAGSATCDAQNPVNKISWGASQGVYYYNVYRNGDYFATVYAPTTSYDDYNISYGNSYTYQIKAVSAQGIGTWSSNTITLNAAYCNEPHVTILPSLSSILAGQSQTLAWTGTNVNRVDILNYGNVYSGGVGSPSGTITVEPKETTTYTIKGYNPSAYPPDEENATVYVGNLGMSGGGDIYSGNVLSDAGGKIQFDKRSVLSAKNNITVFDDAYYPWKIPDYNYILWEMTKNKMQKNRDNLVGSAANISSGSYSGVWYLDSDSTNPNVGPRNTSKYPDGKVWHVSGDLTLDNVTFVGKGTVIVDGKVNITGSVAYSNDGNQNTYSVGIIANGNIDIEQNVDYVAGAYFTFATINIK